VDKPKVLERPNYTAKAVEKLRKRVEDGDMVAIMTAVNACLSAAVLPPLWLTEKYIPHSNKIISSLRASEHGRPEVQLRNARLRPFIVYRVQQLTAEGMKDPRARFTKVAEELRARPDGDSESTSAKVEAIYKETSESRGWKNFFKAIGGRPPKELRKLKRLRIALRAQHKLQLKKQKS
jgi:hypothetical protein